MQLLSWRELRGQDLQYANTAASKPAARRGACGEAGGEVALPVPLAPRPAARTPPAQGPQAAPPQRLTPRTYPGIARRASATGPPPAST